MRVKFTPNPLPDPTQAPIPPLTAQPQPEIGVVRMSLDPNPLTADATLPDLLGARGSTLADLIDVDPQLPGAYWRTKTLLDIETTTLPGEGGYSSPDGGFSAAASRPPIALSRRCIGGGRLEASLRAGRRGRAGHVEGVRDVNFKFGKRTVARDTSRPFVQVIPRDTLARAPRTSLRAVVYLERGGG